MRNKFKSARAATETGVCGNATRHSGQSDRQAEAKNALPGFDGRLGLSVKEITDALGISRTVTYDLLASGRLTRIKIGRRTVITADSIARLLQDATRG